MPKPKTGRLPMWENQPEKFGPPRPEQFAIPPWGEVSVEPKAEIQSKKNIRKLRNARKRVEELTGVIRNEAFNDWIRRYLNPAQQPNEWTQSRILYANYCKRARLFGSGRGNKDFLAQLLASETQWGKMMGSLFPKQRRRGGNYYPVRLKKGA